jgi:hypothetical protein
MEPWVTGVYNTAVTNEFTAVSKTSNNQYIWYRGYRQVHRGFLYRVRQKPQLTAVYQMTPRYLIRKPRLDKKNRGWRRFFSKIFSVGSLAILKKEPEIADELFCAELQLSSKK